MATSSAVFILLTIVLLPIHIAFAANPVRIFCSTTSNFTDNSSFKPNLDKLLSNLSMKTPPSGFSLQTVAGGSASVFGMAMCRGDIKSTECADCVNDATANIVQSCPNNREAMIWFDTCFLKYSDSKSFGIVDVSHERLIGSVGNSTQPFFQAVVKLLRRLSQQASLSPKLFAAGELKADLGNGGGDEVFGLVECTRDLSSIQCKNCIDGTISVLPAGKVGTGGRILGASCSIRFETFAFF